ncbi:MAG: cache domain-containing protein [Lachnospiraceae bacterium]|nr:cache domain-containing protein [Lachnospiraceae bacterium]
MKKTRLLYVLMVIGFVPLLVSLIISITVSISKITNELKSDTNTILSVYTDSLNNYFGVDWTSSTSVKVVDEDYEFIDSGKENNVEMTLFKANSDGSVTRYISSIITDSGKRAFGTAADADITEAVYGKGETVFKEGVIIAGKSYTVCYKPFEDENGKRVGMCFAGRLDANLKSARVSLIKQFVIVAVLLIVVFGAIIVLFSKAVITPLQKVTDATTKLADADISHDIVISSKIRETSAIIDSAVKLRSNLNNIVNDIKKSSVSLKDVVGETKALCSDVASGADVIDTVVQELSNTACSLDSTISTINEQVIHMGSNIESVSASVNALRDSSKMMNEISENSSQDLSDVYEASLKSVASASNISEHMTKLNEAIVRVTAATDMISGIANKTRLLSLNASIEAARAGESGRGFAVVADEIGALAANSAESVKQINEIVEDIISLSAESSKVIGEIGGIIEAEQEKVMQTRESFKLLKEQVDASVDQISIISGDTTSLTSAKQTVISAISDLSAIAQENAASCEECSASVSNIATTINHVNDRTKEIEAAADVLENYIHVFH